MSTTKPREIVVISGKGGTGKTSVTGALAHLARSKVICDLDVDAPDLHILLSPHPRVTEDFVSGNEAVIDASRCTGCGTCAEMCRFGAVVRNGAVSRINPLRCEGCKVCVAFCPEHAIDFPPRRCGTWSISETRFGTMVHAQLFPGQENSGRLVVLLKNHAREIAMDEGLEIVLCDGAPGIGCPVISSLSGTHLAVAVTEPTPSGRHDLERVAGLCGHFRIPLAVIVNKHDLNPEQTRAIQAFCGEAGHEVVALLPHDPEVTRAMVQRKVVTELPDTPFTGLLASAWERICALAGADGA